MASQSKFQIFADRHCDTTAWIDVTDTYADNDNIEYEADVIIDFTTRNPFGMP